jgi:hypothetical protein
MNELLTSIENIYYRLLNEEPRYKIAVICCTHEPSKDDAFDCAEKLGLKWIQFCEASEYFRAVEPHHITRSDFQKVIRRSCSASPCLFYGIDLFLEGREDDFVQGVFSTILHTECINPAIILTAYRKLEAQERGMGKILMLNK